MGGANAQALVRIYLMSDEQAQLLIAAILGGMTDLSVHLKHGWQGHSLVVECTSIAQANLVERFVKWIDPHAVLAHTTNGTADALVA